MILQLAVIFLFLAAGEFTVWLTGIPVPSSIIGMMLLTLALQLKVVDLHHVAGVSDFLVGNLGFFFIPAGVGLLGYADLISNQWQAIVGASALSTFIVIGVTGRVHQIARHFTSNHLHGLSRK
ncbi:MAG: CidA/LrgA family protein [Muribaculaceae bacterium]|nr:CidA/LrgA family protein [Muribaculaceae bacterium]